MMSISLRVNKRDLILQQKVEESNHMDMTKKIVLEEKDCPLGCNKNDEVLVTGGDRLHNLPGNFNVLKCRECGLMRTQPRPTPESMSFYYPDEYGPYAGTRVEQRDDQKNAVLKKMVKGISRSIFRFNTQKLPHLPPGRLLELGCASGSFLHKMALKGWEVQGIEISEKPAQAAIDSGYDVHIGALETAPAPDNTFDLIVGWMVLEHLHDPGKCLLKLREWANPEAWLVLSVPNAGSLEFKIFKDKWYSLHLPNHLYHFTPLTIEKMLLKNGWRVEKIFHQKVLGNLIASFGYVLHDNGFKKIGNKFIGFPENSRCWNYILYPFALLLSLFGETGRMTVWARLKHLEK